MYIVFTFVSVFLSQIFSSFCSYLYSCTLISLYFSHPLSQNLFCKDKGKLLGASFWAKTLLVYLTLVLSFCASCLSCSRWVQRNTCITEPGFYQPQWYYHNLSNTNKQMEMKSFTLVCFTLIFHPLAIILEPLSFLKLLSLLHCILKKWHYIVSQPKTKKLGTPKPNSKTITPVFFLRFKKSHLCQSCTVFHGNSFQTLIHGQYYCWLVVL